MGKVESQRGGFPPKERINPMHLHMHQARRCLARTRHGRPCQSPAMTNGRCRMQGGTDASPAQIRSLVGGVQSSLANHVGKTVERLGQGMPKRWRGWRGHKLWRIGLAVAKSKYLPG